MPKFPSAKRDQRACGMPLLPASIFRSIKKKKSIEISESPGLGKVRRGQERSSEAEGSYRAFESKSLLWGRK